MLFLRVVSYIKTIMGVNYERAISQFCSQQHKNDVYNSIRKAHSKLASIEKSLRVFDAIYQTYSHQPQFNFIIEDREYFDDVSLLKSQYETFVAG